MPNVKDNNDPDLDTGNTGDGDGGPKTDDSGQRLISANKVNEIVSSRVNELNAKHAAEMEVLKVKMEQSINSQPKEEVKVYTRAELDGFIGEGRLSQEDADGIIDKQLTNQITNNVTNNMLAQQKQDTLGKLIEKYVAHDPDVAISGTDARNRIETEVAAQFRISGDAQMSLKHEALALRAIYGDDKNLGNVDLNPIDRETHMDSIVSTAQPGDSDRGGGEKTLGKISSDERAYYQDLINKGTYSGWDAVAKEMKYANKALRNRAGLR